VFAENIVSKTLLPLATTQSNSAFTFTSVTIALNINFNVMRYINSRFTNFTYLFNYACSTAVIRSIASILRPHQKRSSFMRLFSSI